LGLLWWSLEDDSLSAVNGEMGRSPYQGKLDEQDKWRNIGDSIANPILKRKILMS